MVISDEDKKLIDAFLQEHGFRETLSEVNKKTLDTLLTKALFKALQISNFNIINIILKTDVNINQANQDGNTPLHLATFHHDVAVISKIINKGAVLDKANRQTITALHIAAMSGQTEKVKLLLDKGAKINHQDRDGWSPLHYAASQISSSTDLIAMLIKYGAEIDQPEKNSWTALHILALAGQTEKVKLLLDNNATINIETINKETALHLSVKEGYLETSKLLLDKGAKINHQDRDGNQPLINALLRNHIDTAMVELLLYRGAYIEHGYIAEQIANLGTRENNATLSFAARLYGWNERSTENNVESLKITSIKKCDDDIFAKLKKNMTEIIAADQAGLFPAEHQESRVMTRIMRNFVAFFRNIEPRNTYQIVTNAMFNALAETNDVKELLENFIQKTSKQELSKFKLHNLESLLIFRNVFPNNILYQIAEYVGPFSDKSLDKLLEGHFKEEKSLDLQQESDSYTKANIGKYTRDILAQRAEETKKLER